MACLEIVRKPELEACWEPNWEVSWEIALRPELEVELEVRKLGSTPLRCWKFAERRAKLEERRGESGVLWREAQKDSDGLSFCICSERHEEAFEVGASGGTSFSCVEFHQEGFENQGAWEVH